MAKCSKQQSLIGVELDGRLVIAPVDPCVYEEIEAHTNVTVRVSKCLICGELELSWSRTDSTESIY